MKSPDLKEWVHLGLLLHDDMPTTIGVKKDEDISCANMFKIGNKWMLLCISHGLGCRYYLGDFKDEKYLPEFHAMMNWKGWEFFAPESVLTPDGRRVMWAWCVLKDVPLQAGIQSLPRELSLPEDGVLRIKPLRELETLRYDEKSEANITVKSDGVYKLKEIAGDAIEFKATFSPTKAKQFGVRVYGDKDGNGGFPITVEPENKTLALGAMKVPFELKADENLELRIFLDKNMIEVFANDRQAAVAPHKYAPENLGVSLFSKDEDVVVREAKGWKMKSIYGDK
jgi:sucrose-6-phosphate hydrolase SacC (GH32 family)